MNLTRRQFIIVAGVGAAAIAFGVSKDRPDLDFLENTPRKGSTFALAEAGEIDVQTVPQLVIDNTNKDWTQAWNTSIGKEWYQRGGTDSAKKTIYKALAQTIVAAEANEKVAESYLNYCRLMLLNTWAIFNYKSPFQLGVYNPTIAPHRNQGLIVNGIQTKFYLSVKVEQDGVPTLEKHSSYDINTETLGGRRVWNIKGTTITEPLLFATAGKPAYKVLFTPVIEGVHEMMITTFEDAVKAESTRKSAVVVNEAVAHAAGMKVMHDFTRRYKLPLGNREFEDQYACWADQERYSKISIAEKLVEQEGVVELVKRYNSDPKSVEKDLFK